MIDNARERPARVPAQVLVLGGAMSVQFGSAFANKLFPLAGPAGVVFLRLAFGAVVLLAAVRPSWRGRTRSDWRAVIGFGVMLAGMNWSFYEALDRTPLGPAVTIEFIGPLVVAVLGSRRWLDTVWVALAGGGVAILGLGGSGSGQTALHPAGVALALLAGAFWAGYIMMSKQVGTRFAGLDGLASALVVGSVLLVVPGVLGGGSALLTPHVLLGGLAVAMLSSVIPYSLELTALRRLSAAAFGLLMSLEPAVAALAGVLVLHQALRLTTAVAIAMVIVASAGSTLFARRALPAHID
ncbi:EamA family transporter [Jatrophihabitans telluris]|uniref:EamA family transporter n=1 Tax=Jatrophihabitans telluris TaxID=2038343 RepID=A0ABY4QXI0_9ACTN|nr:EamA family transporter [Jatrophihabitans telluris]UQX87852.1 EamA family transporter [Jatrophihabitans telluris]